MNIKINLSNLCYYDKRNPDYIGDDLNPKSDCMCDNCFYGRTKLTEQLLVLQEHVDILLKQVK